MAGKRITFATTNFDQASGKPSDGPWGEMSAPEFNAVRSSKFNGFSVPDLEKLVFTEGSDKAKLGIEDPNGSSELIPVQIYNGSGTEVNIPKEEDPIGIGFEGFEGTLFGNSDSFPVGNGTGWIEVDLDFLVKIFWRVKTWKASISGSFSSLSLSGECNPNNTSASANESILVSDEDVLFAEESDPLSEEENNDSDPENTSSESLSFQLKPQKKQQILRSQPSHLGNSMSTMRNAQVTRNEIFILKVQGANNNKFFINPLSLYSFEASAGGGKFDDFTPPPLGEPPEGYDPENDNCYDTPGHSDWLRGWSIQYRSTLSPVKASYINKPDENDCESINMAWSGRKTSGYTLNINTGGDSRSYSMPLSYSAASFSLPATYSDWTSTFCEGTKPLLKNSLDSFPVPNITVTLEPAEYWEYDDGKGNAIWDKTTGQKLRDPITGT
jgi:hypothetical protein